MHVVLLSITFFTCTLHTGAIGLHVAFFGEGVGIIFVDDAECIGNETSILDCSHLGIGTSNCFHNEDVSVLCQGKAVLMIIILYTLYNVYNISVKYSFHIVYLALVL